MKFNRQISKNNPCPPDCPKRNAECHAKCKDYKDWRAELDRKNAERRKELCSSDLISDAKKKAIWKNSRYSRKNMKLLSNKYDTD